MQHLLAPVARYWWRDETKPQQRAAEEAPARDPLDNAKWKLIDHEEWKRRKGMDPRVGSLELFGQSLRVSWMTLSENGFPVVTSESP
eukprot:8303998-Lingulodinium_polyedra.AAC.1